MFISSVNVCFDGKEIINGDERNYKWIECRRCLSIQRREGSNCQHQTHLDTYSKSKQEAEKIVIANSNQGQIGSNFGENNNLNTCVLRYVRITSSSERHILNDMYTITTLYRYTFLLLRLAGVYGPGEKMIVKRSLAYLDSKIASNFVCYNRNLQTDFVHIRNVVQSTIKVTFIARYSYNQYRVIMYMGL